jgi:hypothetical protein
MMMLRRQMSGESDIVFNYIKSNVSHCRFFVETSGEEPVTSDTHPSRSIAVPDEVFEQLTEMTDTTTTSAQSS